MIGPRPWRVTYKPTDRRREPATAYPCALAHWATRDGLPSCNHSRVSSVNAMVWDHCHLHGFIRGPLCNYHNGRMRHYDDGREVYTYEPDLIEYARLCAECSGPW
ncbi:endonuclease domain-containing protein [Streptomyces sp.]|uniref:endonuclease domain-containing protein n=1 Tax=Streptomyces sp. TaxID=1931 RepID=UPI002F952BFC